LNIFARLRFEEGDVLNGKDNAAECEQVIQQVKGVSSVRVILGKEGIDEAHIVSDGTRLPKQLVRDIESAMLVQLGINLDHKKISVVQFAGREPIPASLPARLRLNSIKLTTEGRSAEAMVSIAAGLNCFSGTATGLNTAKNKLRLVVIATLEAVHAYRGLTKFSLEDVQKSMVGSREVLLVAISLLTDRGEDGLLGIAFVNGDERESVAKATLDAINRRLALREK